MTDEKENQVKVPQIILIYEKTEHKGLQGSYCWGEICVDYTHPSKRLDFKEKIQIQKNSTITFKINHPTKPDQLHLTIFSQDQLVSYEAIEKHLRIQLSKGTYFLSFKASWNILGDASNVFLIEVT
jgi:hypothetical protein